LIMRGEAATPEAFMAMAEHAERLELDAVWASDHIVVPPQTVSTYKFSADGKLPQTWRERYWEPLTVLSFLAAHTRRVRLGTSVFILPMRNPIEAAHQVAQADQLSGGRIDLGVGVGWFTEEFEVLGWPFRQRGARTTEGLRVAKALWTEEAATHHGRFYDFEGVRSGPKPVQRPHPPLWIGGKSAAALRRAAALGDWWQPIRPTPEELREGRDRLDEMAAETGRPAGSVKLAVKCPLVFQDEPGDFFTKGPPDAVVEGIGRLREAGAEAFVFDIAPETLGNALETMGRFAHDVKPKL